MSAVLRVWGAEFDPDAFLAGSPLAASACRIFHRGEPALPRTQPQGRRHEHSGVHLSASDADFDEFDRQIEEATAFLKANRDEIRRLASAPGVEAATLDFGINRRDVPLQCDYLPPPLVRLAGELGLGLEISHYAFGERSDPAAPNGESA